MHACIPSPFVNVSCDINICLIVARKHPVCFLFVFDRVHEKGLKQGKMTSPQLFIQRDLRFEDVLIHMLLLKILKRLIIIYFNFYNYNI